MKNNSFFEKYKSGIIIVVILGAWLAFVSFVIMPAQKSLREEFILVEKKKLDNIVSADKLEKLPILEKDFNLIADKSGDLDVIFSKDKIVDLVKDLELIADRTGNKINISVEDEKKIVAVSGKAKIEGTGEEFIENLPNKNYFKINISLIGDYNGLINFINKLNNIRYYNTIESFELASAKEVIEEDLVNSNNSGISLMSSGDGLGEDGAGGGAKEDRLVLESKLGVLFYTLEKKDENK